LHCTDDLIVATRIQIKFEPNQDYQLEAVDSVARLFEGYGRRDTAFILGDEIVPNLPPSDNFDRSWLLENLRGVQDTNGISYGPLDTLEVEDELVLAGVGNESWEYPSFTVEMETGTGKTYVYLRTIQELRKRYGFGKFIIIVPSVAIYEGVVKNFEITRSHFAALYGNEQINLIRYDGAQLSRLRTFATSTFAEIMVITLDAFNKVSNNIYKTSEKLAGERKPYQFIQETRPILILDEPQNMDSPLSRSALATLHPLLALRYSATHRRSPNLVYRLTPFEAFRRNLVKRIQVVGVTDRDDCNRPFLSLERITTQGGIRATVTTYVDEGGRTREADVVLRHGDDLFAKTRREEHRTAYRVEEINAAERVLRFENGLQLRVGETLGPSRPELFRVQIEETIRQHYAMQRRLRERGIKVLSLFFIDRVANYTADDGIIKALFDGAFRRLQRTDSSLPNLDPENVRAAYFATVKTKTGEDQAVDIALEDQEQTRADREAAKGAYELIMRDKERLLSFDEPVAFIFAHSALKEGWDNPNVFQICTLNQTQSEMRKRQEIGRGLRLCVDQRGERAVGDDVNVLTIVANQSYQSYANSLQQEYVDDGEADAAPPKPSDAKRRSARRNDRIFLDDADFREFWRRLAQRISYRIHIDTAALTARCIERLANEQYPEPKIVVQRGDYIVHRYTFTLDEVRGRRARITVQTENTLGDKASSVRYYSEGDDLARIHNDQRLRGFTILQCGATPEGLVAFENREVIYRAQPRTWESAEGQRVREQATLAGRTTYRVFNLIERAAKETGLTRSTINAIFKGLPSRTKVRIFENPEGFAGVFMSTIRGVLADHISEAVEFVVDGPEDSLNLEELFPKEKMFPQKELIEAGDRGLYDLVQKDSGVEASFVEQRLKGDPEIIFHFKFPPAFRVQFPRLIGNYNPDWGIVRRSPEGRLKLYLIRETKGTTDLNALQFPHEKRKIACATTYFKTVGMDYRVISDRTGDWWHAEASLAQQQDLGV
jgi:type III restriction enzyme